VSPLLSDNCVFDGDKVTVVGGSNRSYKKQYDLNTEFKKINKMLRYLKHFSKKKMIYFLYCTSYKYLLSIFSLVLFF